MRGRVSDNQIKHFINRGIHPHNEKDDFRTPMYIIDWLKDHFGDNLLDAACSEENKKGEYINIFKEPASYAIFDLTTWIYINPPFDMQNCIDFTQAGALWNEKGWPVVMLLPNKLCSKSYCEKINIHFDEIICLGGRINFESPYAAKGGTSMNGCFLGIMYGDVMKKNEYPVVKSLTLAQIKKGEAKI